MGRASAKPKPRVGIGSPSSHEQVVSFPIDEIIVGERVSGLNEAAVRELAKSIEAVGLLHPITLSAFRLTAHR